MLGQRQLQEQRMQLAYSRLLLNQDDAESGKHETRLLQRDMLELPDDSKHP
jgi:hypothetical protein